MNIKKRSGKIAFMKVQETFKRMHGFTSLPTNRNAKEYSRQYVDEEFERSDVIGYATSMDFNFDAVLKDSVHDLIVDIFDGEKTGANAVVTIMQVDLDSGTETDGYSCVTREFSVIPGAEGGSLDAYTYEGTFKAAGSSKIGKVTLDASKETATAKTE